MITRSRVVRPVPEIVIAESGEKFIPVSVTRTELPSAIADGEIVVIEGRPNT
jgi:hypothetical protein